MNNALFIIYYAPRRYEKLCAGEHVTNGKDWEETVKVKTSMYKVEAASDPTHLYESAANPNRLVCGCKTWRHDSICKHVLAVNHFIEAKKPVEERDSACDLDLLQTELYDVSAHKRIKGKSRRGLRSKGAKGGYKMTTNSYSRQHGVGEGAAERQAIRKRRAAATKGGKGIARGGYAQKGGRGRRGRARRDEDEVDDEEDEEDALVQMPSPAGNGGERLDEEDEEDAEERIYESEQARAKRAEEAAAAARKQRDQRAEARLHNDAQNNSCSALFIMHK